MRHFLEARLRARIGVRILFRKFHAVGSHHLLDVFRDTCGRRESGGLDAGNVKEAVIRLDNEIVDRTVRTNAREIADILTEINGRHALCRHLAHESKIVRTSRRVAGSAVHCVRTDDQIAVNGRRNQHALADFGRALENDVTDARAFALVKQIICAFVRKDLKRVRQHHIVNYARFGTGSVNDILRLDRLAARGDREAAVDLGDGFDFRFQTQFHAVHNGRFRKSQGIFPRVDNSCGGRVERARYVVGDIGLHFLRFFVGKNAKSRNAVCNAAVIQPLYVRGFFVAEREHKRTDLRIGNVELFGKHFRQIHAAHVQFRHQRTLRRIVTGVDDRAVGSRAAHSDVVLLFQHDRLQIESGKTVGNGGADHAAADNCYIIHRSHTSISSIGIRQTNIF